MHFPARSTARFLTVLSLGAMTLSPIAAQVRPISSLGLQAPAANAIDAQATHTYRPEVRLRKLHLVRPDLIPYPIAYAVYC
jgi:hypothetical protein